MVANRIISPSDLRSALRHQKLTQKPLGKILIDLKLVSKKTLYATLMQQATLRTLAAAFSLFIGLSSLSLKQAHAESFETTAAIVQVAAAAPVQSFDDPLVFGAEGDRNNDLSAFTKWSGMFANFETALRDKSSVKMVKRWERDLKEYEGLSVIEKAHAVNAMMNKKPYIEDIDNWGQSDYWAHPVQFDARGGDCEDFAIAKYVALRALGVAEQNLRIAIVHDMQRDLPHAVLVLFDKGQSYVLDNQMKSVQATADVTRYFPIYSINQNAWWLHNNPSDVKVVLAAAE